MAGKISDAEKNSKVGNKFNSNMVKISSSKSILSYQNGSALNTENCEETADEGMPGAGYPEEIFLPQEPFSEDQNLKSDCLDLLRKKLISDLSLTVFSPDLENKLAKMEPIEISKERQSVIQKLLVQISQLSDAEKLLLYLKLPCSTSSPFDPLRQPLNPLGNRQEIQQTIVWIKTHLEEDSEISIPKQDVYDQYLKYCENVSMKPLSTADFGKVMKQVYPGVRPRRLGTRGNSRYCYSGMRNTCKLPTPILPQSSTENLMSNGGSNDGPPLSAESNKYKKMDRAKRKSKATGCRSEKCSPLNRTFAEPEKDGNYDVQNVKRLKMEEKEGDLKEGDRGKEEASKNQIDAERIKEEVDLSGIKCEESSNNSFNAFEIDCGLASDFGIYFKNLEKGVGNSSMKSSELVCDSPVRTECEEKQNKIQKMVFNDSGSSQMLTIKQNEKGCSEGNVFPLGKPDPGNSRVGGKMNGLDGLKSSALEQRKIVKGRSRRSTSLSKPPKNLRKCYVPIQPKPVDMQNLNVRFEQPIGISNFPSEQKRDLEGPPLCEESDSQEPEEEIIRYFKHLDENELSANNFVDEAVKNIDSTTVQNSGTSQVVLKNAASYRRVNEALNNASQQILRSQSCFEVQRQLFNLGENIESVNVPRSQSSVELPTMEGNHREALEPESASVSGKNKKISHLRILLEKSICAGNVIPYSGLRESSNVLTNGNNVISTSQTVSPGNQTPANEQNCLLSHAKLISNERDLLRLNGLKVLNSGPSYVPHSPNNRTRYFSFTPISPGPQSPLKTPSTPSASPFVSPRDTPVPRSRQNSSNDFFLSPFDRKSTSRSDSGKIEVFSENDFNFSKAPAGRVEKSKHLTFLQGCRPRSFSSTNFCRSKTRRNSSKAIGSHLRMNAAPDRAQTVTQNNFLNNSQFSIHKNFVSSECLSNEVRKFLKNNSAVTEDQSATIRSQSVPLNRMISESAWTPPHLSSVYSTYFTSAGSNLVLPSLATKFPEWTSNSETNSPKDLPLNASPFLTNGDIPGMVSAPLNSEVFPGGDSAITPLDDHYFAGDFRPGNDEGFSENDPFHEDSTFSSKLDINSTGTFDSPFTSESDPAIAENIKSYLPDFEGLESKTLDNEGLNDRKLLKTSLYERGSDNLKDPVITSFKPVITSEISSCPGSPVLNFFGTRMNEDNQQLIEFFDFED